MTAGTRWSHEVWGDYALFTNREDFIQRIDLPATGGLATDLTTDLRARYLAVVKDSFLLAGDTWDSVDGDRPQRVRWPAINNPLNWTVGQNLADLQDLRGEGGA
ncbi:MAG: hypothetical protein R3330_12495, partial [Saprospiraceae bacterium]|nr:hypothetical protein [Saprospiraceae bacterium]